MTISGVLIVIALTIILLPMIFHRAKIIDLAKLPFGVNLGLIIISIGFAAGSVVSLII